MGYGSIGKRHARLLGEAGHDVHIVSSQALPTGLRGYPTLAEASAFLRQADLVLLASVTARHQADLSALLELGYRGPVLVEKPLFDRAPTETPPPEGMQVSVAYNLRFHPVIRALRATLKGKRLRAAMLCAGQHLAQWRPGRTVTSTYSAHRDQGGGVVRDLSHEIDLARHLFGPLSLQASHSARVSEITVDSEDIAIAVMRTPNCPFVSVEIDYLDLQPRRQIRVLTDDETIEADLIRGMLSVNGVATQIPLPPDESYRLMHDAALDLDNGVLCSWQEGLETVTLIDKIAPHA
ncbi:Legionaminic acid biosynthesis protein PtmF [plant metagenome]|uniref:Legionaminic acid biosynthesis protein PtmF n=1 Tax=plant metagenome TaxID=1297885 RepID=A0A484XYS3_9ZZZZ